MSVAVTGANGFIGKNLVQRCRELNIDVRAIPHDATVAEIADLVSDAKVVFHLAGVNRPKDPTEFTSGNAGFTQMCCEALAFLKRAVPAVYTSSIQAAQDNPYGRSKREAEAELEAYARASGAPVFIYRLPNVFGKWSQPNYNSAVATFCHNIARDIPIAVNNNAPLTLVYIDDVVEAFMAIARGEYPAECIVRPVYQTTVGEVAAQIREFRNKLVPNQADTGLTRALYATYMSYLPTQAFD